MLTAAQRIDLLKVAVDLSKSVHAADGAAGTTLDETALDVFRRLRAEVEDGAALDEADMGEVKAAVDVASGLEELIE